MKEKITNSDDIVEAIQDLTRVLLAVNGEFTSKSEIIRRLSDLSIPPSRIARLLDMQLKDVTSAISKKKKSNKKGNKVLRHVQSADSIITDDHEETVPS